MKAKYGKYGRYTDELEVIVMILELGENPFSKACASDETLVKAIVQTHNELCDDDKFQALKEENGHGHEPVNLQETVAVCLLNIIEKL